MKLQTLILPDTEADTELYYRGSAALNGGETLSFDTYYNSFSYTKYRAYTPIREVCFSCAFSGVARVELCVFDGRETVLCGIEAEGEATLTAELSSLPMLGFLYARITALTDCVFINGEYGAECEPNPVNVCVAICTYKREQYVRRNIELLRGFRFSSINRVFVIDNGNSLPESRLSDPLIRIVPNKNYGGSGGFTRGLIEAVDGGFSHVIFMDDDVEFYPEVLERMTVFLSLLCDQYAKSWISASMFPMHKRWEQHECGSEWDGKMISHKARADMRKREMLLDNLDNPGVGCGGWWTLCMPVSVTENGLPFPFFIKFDDVEYGLRKPPETEIITMNGVGIYHEAFDRKISFVIDYYHLRNELVMNAAHNRSNTVDALKRFWHEILKQLFLYRYDNCVIVIKAIDDFLGGVDFFLKTDEEELNRELIQKAIKLIPLRQIDEWSEELRNDAHKKDKRITVPMALTAGGHFIPSYLLQKEVAAFPLSAISARDVFGKKAVVQYQLGGDVGVVTQRSFFKLIKYTFMGIGASFRLLHGYSGASKSYLSRRAEITSFGFWRKHLGLSDEAKDDSPDHI
ncbi:MAG: glycosyltransferase [Bacteroides sp.]|nr:glycosyltransferase [Eubacterium sp.]MCM1417961.1 glycosyltransferase [Roseburia sp.]MCM1461792.1 glycosyltransferase [Bacteroides sp.]